MKRIVAICFILLSLAACHKDIFLDVEGKQVYNLSSSQVRITIPVSTNSASWEYVIYADDTSWLVEQSKSDGVLTLLVKENDSTEPRTASVEFFAPTIAKAAATESVSIKQAGKLLEPEISLQSQVEAESGGGVFGIDVNTNQVGWECEIVDAGAEWLSVSNVDGYLHLDVQPNPTEYERSARVRLYAPDKVSALVYADIVVIQKALIIYYDPVNLSEAGSSNCYIITHKGEYSFDARVRGNGASTSGLPAPTPLEPAGAKLVWQTAKGMIEEVSYKDGAISFVASKIHGSAVIAATNNSGDIIWSWHIWFPAVAIEELACESGSKMMNLNLGAQNNEPANISSHGMLYQWGRKDPFPYSPYPNNGSITTLPIKVYDIDGNAVPTGHTDMYSLRDNSLAFSIAHPETCISNNYQYASCRDWLLPAESNGALWGNPSGDERVNGAYLRSGSKSIYDPCPLGWKVASIKDLVYMTESGGYTWATGDTQSGFVFNDLGGPAEVAVVDLDGDGVYTMKDYKDGWTIYLNKSMDVQSYFPAATRYDGQYAMLMGSMVGLWGSYWTNTANNSAGMTPGLAVGMSFAVRGYNGENNITISPVASGSRADAYSVRCIKE